VDPLRDARVRSPSARGRRAAPTEADEGNWCISGTFDGDCQQNGGSGTGL